MADAQKWKPGDPLPELDPKVLKEFQALTDTNKRIDFYHANPGLRRLYSEGNFHRPAKVAAPAQPS